MEENYIIFYTFNTDWKKECRACLYKDFNKDTMKLLEADYDTINTVFRKQNIDNWEINRVDARYKDENSSTYHNIKWVDFDPRKMDIAKDKNKFTEINIKEMVKQKRAPGLVEKTSRDRGSVMHRGKVDEGAMSDLLDKTLPGAKVRAVKRFKNKGASFTKNKSNQTFLRRK